MYNTRHTAHMLTLHLINYRVKTGQGFSGTVSCIAAQHTRAYEKKWKIKSGLCPRQVHVPHVKASFDQNIQNRKNAPATPSFAGILQVHHLLEDVKRYLYVVVSVDDSHRPATYCHSFESFYDNIPPKTSPKVFRKKIVIQRLLPDVWFQTA